MSIDVRSYRAWFVVYAEDGLTAMRIYVGAFLAVLSANDGFERKHRFLQSPRSIAVMYLANLCTGAALVFLPVVAVAENRA